MLIIFKVWGVWTRKRCLNIQTFQSFGTGFMKLISILFLHSLHIGAIWFPQTGSLHLSQTVLTLLMLDFEAICPVQYDFVIQVLHGLVTLTFDGDGGMPITGALSGIFKNTWREFGSLPFSNRLVTRGFTNLFISVQPYKKLSTLSCLLFDSYIACDLILAISRILLNLQKSDFLIPVWLCAIWFFNMGYKFPLWRNHRFCEVVACIFHPLLQYEQRELSEVTKITHTTRLRFHNIRIYNNMPSSFLKAIQLFLSLPFASFISFGCLSYNAPIFVILFFI